MVREHDHGLELDPAARTALEEERARHQAEIRAIEQALTSDLSRRLQEEDQRHFEQLKRIYAELADRKITGR